MQRVRLAERLRAAKGDRSIDAISAHASAKGFHIDRTTVARYLRGDGAKNPPENVLQALAAGLDLDVRELRVLADKPGGELDAWVPPPEAARLSRAQRRALETLIKTMVAQQTPPDGIDLPDLTQESPPADS